MKVTGFRTRPRYSRDTPLVKKLGPYIKPKGSYRGNKVCDRRTHTRTDGQTNGQTVIIPMVPRRATGDNYGILLSISDKKVNFLRLSDSRWPTFQDGTTFT